MKPLPPWIIILRRTLLGAAVAATVVAAAVVEENVRGELDWRRFEKDRAAGGLPVNFAFYGPPPVPEDQNLILAPPLARFFNAEDDTSAAWAALEKRIALPWQIPAVPQPYPGPRQIRDSWQQGRFLPLGSAPAEDPQKEARLFLAAIAPLKADLDAIAAAASWRTRAQIPFLPDAAIVHGSLFAMRTLCHLLSWRASAELQLGQTETAFADTYAALRIAEACVHYPTVIHALFGNVLITEDVQPLWEGWIRGVWSNEQLARFQTAVTPFHTYLELGRVVAATGAAGLLENSLVPSPNWLPSGWRKQASIQILRHASPSELQRLDTEHKPITTANLQRLFVITPADKAELPLRFVKEGNTSVPILYPRTFGTIAVGQTALQLATVACALQRYQRAVGRYPTDLGALVPDYLSEVPFDYNDGNRLRYHPTPAGRFVLYSIGGDGRDDDGALPTFSEKGWPWSQEKAAGDWTWPTQVTPTPSTHS